jgi:thymidylate kinase
MHSQKPMQLSFSGVDGAGKSTQIDALVHFLEESGYGWKLCTFWDDVVAFSRWRERLSLKIFKGDRGVGSPDRPIVRRDKNVTSLHVVLFRLVLYFLDALRLCAVVRHCQDENVDFLIFDRYIYDELANLPLQHRSVRLYTRLLLRIAPRPDIAFLLDADPEKAHERKPEYPLEFVRRNREAYLQMAHIADMSIVAPSPISEMTETVRRSVCVTLRRDAVLKRIPTSCPPSAESAKTGNS